MFEIAEKLDPAILKGTLKILIEQHDALRTQFKVKDNKWQAEVVKDKLPLPFTHFDLSGQADRATDALIKEKADTLQSGFDLGRPPLIKMAYFSLPAGQADKLFIAIHHLVVDGFSWRIITEDIQLIYKQLANNEAVRLAPKTTSFKYWGDKICAYAQTGEIRDEVNYWSAFNTGVRQLLPVDNPAGANTEHQEETLSFELGKDDTDALLQEVPGVYNTQINEALLSALVTAFGRWTGKKQLLLYMEGHGREALFEDVDLSRTVGWFTTLYPVSLDASECVDAGETLKYVKENLREIPGNGLGFGLINYLSGLEKQVPAIDVLFNYLGQFSGQEDNKDNFKMIRGLSGYDRAANGKRMAILDISGAIIEGKLRVNIKYAHAMFKKQTIKALCTDYQASLTGLIEHCKGPGAGGYTPSDFAEAGLDQDDLDDLLDDLD